MFYETRLYADVTLQVFFVAASVVGWWRWTKGDQGAELPVRYSAPGFLVAATAAGVVVAAGYGWLLHRFTDAYAPFLDSIILAFSVLGQLLLIWRRVENWWCWLLVNTIAVPLYAVRGLHVTAVLYAAFWVNAIVSLRKWRRLAQKAGATGRAGRASVALRHALPLCAQLLILKSHLPARPALSARLALLRYRCTDEREAEASRRVGRMMTPVRLAGERRCFS